MPTRTTITSGSTVLGRYTTPQGGRKLCGRVKDGDTFLSDEPVSGRGCIYPVDVIPVADGLDAVEAIVELYLQEARSSCAIPMTHTVIGVPDLEDAA